MNKQSFDPYIPRNKTRPRRQRARALGRSHVHGRRPSHGRLYPLPVMESTCRRYFSRPFVAYRIAFSNLIFTSKFTS